VIENGGPCVNSEPSPPHDKIPAERFRTARSSVGRRLAVGILLASACLALGTAFLARRHGKAAPPLAPSSPLMATQPTLDTTSAEVEPADAGSLTSSLAEAMARALAWKPPVASAAPSAADQKAALGIQRDDHYLGSNEASVTLMLFGDLNCPFTLSQFKMLKGVLDEKPLAFRLVWRERPLDIHDGAPAAALAAERLALRFGERAFWRFVMALSEYDRVPSNAELRLIEDGLSVDKSRLDETKAEARAAAKLERDRLVALTYSIHETPTLFVNGLRFAGEMSRVHLEQLVSEEQEQVELLLDEAVPPSRLYTIRVDANLLDWVRE